MVRVFDPCAKFGGEEWVGREFSLRGMRCLPASGRTHITAFATLEAEGVNLIRRQLFDGVVPGPIRVAAEHGKNSARWKHRSVPSSDCIKGNVKSGGDGHLLQPQNMRCTLARALQCILIFKLDADNRTAVFPEFALQLLRNLPVEDVNRREVMRIVAAQVWHP